MTKIQESQLTWGDTTIDTEGVGDALMGTLSPSFERKLLEMDKYDFSLGFGYWISRVDVGNSPDLTALHESGDFKWENLGFTPFFTFHPYISISPDGKMTVDRIYWVDHEINSGDIEEGYSTYNYDELVEYLYEQAVEVYRGVEHDTLFGD